MEWFRWILLGLFTLFLLYAVGSGVLESFNWLVDKRVKQGTDKLYEQLTHELNYMRDYFNMTSRAEMYTNELQRWETIEYFNTFLPVSHRIENRKPLRPHDIPGYIDTRTKAISERVEGWHNQHTLRHEQALNASRADDI